jgi:tryptophanyl-tRNA synthetase
MLASLLAVGIDPERSTLFHQDMVRAAFDLLNTVDTGQYLTIDPLGPGTF